MAQENSVASQQLVGNLVACHCCGLIQRASEASAGQIAVCFRCESPMAPRQWLLQSTRASAGLAAAALILYPSAIFMPMLRIHKLGHSIEDSIASGIKGLLADGHLFIGLLVLIFSLIVPPLKLIALLVLSFGAPALGRSHRATTYRLVELLGRWGMLDVLVVAILVAFVKLGDMVSIAPGPGLIAFAGCVLLSLLSSLCFPPQSLWKEQS